MSIRATLLAGAALVAAAVAAGCYTGSAVDTNRNPDSAATSTDGTTPAGAANNKPGSNVHGLTHLPCDVEKLLSDACWKCHGTVPGYGAASTLVTLSDLTAASSSIPGFKEADICLMRMQATGDPMPPPPDQPPTSDMVSVLQNWINAGYPGGHCGETADAGADGAAPASVCTSGNTIPSTTQDDTMAPGTSCLNCHASGGAAQSVFGSAGTIYPTANEPDNCAGASGGSVVITDANGLAHTLATDSVGNFSTTDTIAMPATVVVMNNGNVATMKAPITNGDCNSCHSASPTGDQPGRVLGP